MIFIWKWLRRQFHPCPHDRLGVWFRAEDGKDYETCLDCGSRLLSKVQLGECKTPPWGEQVGLARADPAAVEAVLQDLED